LTIKNLSKRRVLLLKNISMPSPIEQAMRQICEEKGLAYESVLEAIESALGAAYRKDFGDKMQNIEVTFDPASGGMQVYDVKTVVEDIDPEILEKVEAERQARMEAFAKQVEEARARGEDINALSIEEDDGPRFNPKTEIMYSDAQVLKFGAKIGDIIRTELPILEEFGRMAAMTAKQVITQKLREAEREVIFNEFKEREGEVVVGTVQRREGRVVLVDVGRTTAVMRPEDQVEREFYRPGERMKFHIKQVALTTKGPEILVSRTTEELVKKLFEVEIPEVQDGLVDVKSVAREAGARTKVAVATQEDTVDPIGACIGQRGSRIQTIIAELGGEKIDIIEWNADPETFILNALSPAKVKEVDLDDREHTARVMVASDQLSLAIGKGGQNVRLAARLTGWKINISEVGGNGVVESSEGSEQTQEETASLKEETPS
jgi:N utilization substance protein A